MGMLYEAFFRSRAFQDFAAAAPGFEELMCLGKVYNLAAQSEFQRVIFDAPATGHLRELLEVPAATQRAVRVGPLNHNARKIEDLLLDPERTRVLVATLAEEMPVREALEIVTLCRDGAAHGRGPGTGESTGGATVCGARAGGWRRSTRGDFDAVSRVHAALKQTSGRRSGNRKPMRSWSPLLHVPRVVQRDTRLALLRERTRAVFEAWAWDAAALLDEVEPIAICKSMPGPAIP
jgi:hypothetical protein